MISWWEALIWMLIILFASFLAFVAAMVVWLVYNRLRDRARDNWHRFWCRRGSHGPHFHSDRERTIWHDQDRDIYIQEVTKFKRCFRCWQRIEGSEVTEVHDEITGQELRRSGSLSLAGRAVLERFKPKPPPMNTVRKAAGVYGYPNSGKPNDKDGVKN